MIAKSAGTNATLLNGTTVSAMPSEVGLSPRVDTNFDEYDTPEFREKLIEHFRKAVAAAIHENESL